MSAPTPPIHTQIEEAYQAHWKLLAQTVYSPEHLQGLMERHLNEILDHLILAAPEFQCFPLFPVKIRIIFDKNRKALVWGFLQIGEDDALEWIKAVRGESFERHFPLERWIQSSLPQVSKQEVLIALSQLVHELQRMGEANRDTLEVLMQAGVHNYFEDHKMVALARLIDSIRV